MTHPEDTPASRKRALAPDTAVLDGRAARAWTERMAVTPLGGGRYAVESESDTTYIVDLPRGRCSCPDSTYREERCKHRRRVAIEINEGRTPPPGKRPAPCAACGSRAFVPEGAEPPHLCGACQLDPGEPVTDRETGDLLVVKAVTPHRADEFEIPGTDLTVAEYPTNQGYPEDDPVVEAVYPFPGAEQRRYTFPISRLERRPRPSPTSPGGGGRSRPDR